MFVVLVFVMPDELCPEVLLLLSKNVHKHVEWSLKHYEIYLCLLLEVAETHVNACPEGKASR